MITTKGIGVYFLRKVLREKSADAEKDFAAILTLEEELLYFNAMPVSWVEIETLTNVFEKAAIRLFPEHPHPLQEFGRLEAQDALVGIYRFLLRFTTVPMLIQQTARLWHTYYSKGRAYSEKDPKKNSAALIVEDFPELIAKNREIILGYTIGALELTGAKNIQGCIESNNPNQWKWIFQWE